MFAALPAEAWRALGAHPLRTILAMLGMIVGVASVVVMLAVAQGSQERVRQMMRTLGSNVLVVNSGASVASGVRQASGATPTLTLGDVDAIRGLDSVRAVSPTTWNTAQIMFDNQNWLGPIQGAYPDIIEVRDWTLAAGGIFDEHDVRTAARKAVMGGTIAEKLFGQRNPVGGSAMFPSPSWGSLPAKARRWTGGIWMTSSTCRSAPLGAICSEAPSPTGSTA
jgi:putative ABC transport system permease protein